MQIFTVAHAQLHTCSYSHIHTHTHIENKHSVHTDWLLKIQIAYQENTNKNQNEPSLHNHYAIT